MPVKDSLSRWEPNDHFYHVQKPTLHANSPTSPERAQKVQRDVLERQKQELGKTQQKGERLQKNLRSSPHILIVAKAGKTILIAVLFPPIFLFKVVPQWLFINVLSKGWDFAVLGGEKFLSLSQGIFGFFRKQAQFFHKGIGKLTAQWHRTLSFAKATILTPFKNAAKWLQHRGNQFGQLARSLSFSWARAPLHWTKKGMQSFAKTMQTYGQKGVLQIRQLGQTIAKSIAHRMTRPLRGIQKTARASIDRGAKLAELISMRIAKPFSLTLGFVQHRLQQFATAFKKGYRKAQEPIARLTRKILDPIRTTSQKIRSKIAETGKTIATQIAHFIQPLQQVIPAFAPWILAPFRWFQEKAGRFSGKRGGALVKKMKGWKEVATRVTAKLLGLAKKWTLRVAQILGDVLDWIWQWIKKISALAFTQIAWLARKIVTVLHLAKLAFFFLLGVIALSWMLARETIHRRFG